MRYEEGDNFMMRHVSCLSIFLTIISTDAIVAMDRSPEFMDLEKTQEASAGDCQSIWEENTDIKASDSLLTKQIHTPPQLKYSKKMQAAAKRYGESTPGTLLYEENKDAIIRCLENYANPNIAENNPLLAAIKNGDKKFVNILIDYGARENFSDDTKNLPKEIKKLKRN